MKLTVLIPFLLVGASVLVSAADQKSSTIPEKKSKFPKKFDSSIHSKKSKTEEKPSSYLTYDPIPVDEISVPSADYELPSLYMNPPSEYLYTNPEGEVMGMMMPPSDLTQETDAPYGGYEVYEEDPQGDDLRVPEPWSYTRYPDAGSAVYLLSDGADDSLIRVVMQPPSDSTNEQPPSSYVSV